MPSREDVVVCKGSHSTSKALSPRSLLSLQPEIGRSAERAPRDRCVLSRRSLSSLRALTALFLRSLLDRCPRRSHGDGMNSRRCDGVHGSQRAHCGLPWRSLRALSALRPISGRREREVLPSLNVIDGAQR
ncbi:hypothetical protein Bbelb_301740 [Branchiostoma belcheri]|nr:hypothetical protein Bbelb_301740 [Branchiostoma belcheri]